jgi:predicted secreted protein with PEFG-CTERM motif
VNRPAALVLALFAFTFVTLAHAQTECVQVCVAKQFYEQGDAVVISGKIDTVLENTPLIIQVFKDNNRAHIAQVDISQDGSYTYTLIADGPYFKTNGKYTVQASYGVSGSIYETSFEFQTAASSTETTEIFEVNAGDSGTFDVPYSIKGGTLKNIIVDQSILGLIVTIEADRDGSITLDLGRKWIDAKKDDGTDDTYIILIDGLEVPYQETSVGSDSRILTIQFEEGDSDIEIIGTMVIPEFGHVALAILIAAIITVVMVTRRTALRIS